MGSLPHGDTAAQMYMSSDNTTLPDAHGHAFAHQELSLVFSVFICVSVTKYLTEAS